MNDLLGTVPKETGFISRFRKHQGWWRAFVLNAEEGEYWDERSKELKKVCNRMNNGKDNKKNFLSEDVLKAVMKAVNTQQQLKSGIIDEDRLYNNLLSSQPLAFNFFGFFNAHLDIALEFLKTIRPSITEVVDVVFEHAPSSTTDHSAFDFGFIVKSGVERGYIGFECKYTDTFSFQRQKTKTFYGDELDKNYKEYFKIYTNNPDRFPDDYFSYVRNRYYNQLFRNELLAMQLKSEFDFIITGLFCHHEDEKTVNSGLEFQKKIGNRKDDFIVMTYADYFERLQKLNLEWRHREFIMLVWARYCGLEMSEQIREKV
jgi:hypothetical protein